MLQVQQSDLLVEDLGKSVHANVEFAGSSELDVFLAESLVLSLEQHDLSQHLVGERAGHDEGRVTSGTTQVDEATLSEEDDVAPAGHLEAVDLGLDVLDGLGVLLEPGDVDLDVEVADVADDGVVAHGLEVLANDNVTAAGGGDEDLADGGSFLHGDDLVTRDGSLKSVDGIDLGDQDTSTHTVKSSNTALSDITVAGDDGNLTSNHDIGSALDTVDEGFPASVKVVELRLGDGVVDVDGRAEKTVVLVLEHSVEVVDTSSGLLGDTVAVLEHLGVFLVNESSEITTVVENKVELLAVLESVELLLQAPFVLLLGLSLPGEAARCVSHLNEVVGLAYLHWDTRSSNSSSGVVLSGENVAAGPGDLSTESSQGLNEDSGLDGHVKAASNSGALERLVLGVLFSCQHQTRHLNLGELDFPPAESGEGEVGDLELLCWGGHNV